MKAEVLRMTRWQKFGWTAGYSVLSLLSTWWMFRVDAILMPGQVTMLYFLMALLPLQEAEFALGILLPWLLYVLALLIVPVMAAFRRYWPLWAMMILGLTGRFVMAVVCLSESYMQELMLVLLSFVLGLSYALLTARLFGYPEPARTVPEEMKPRWYRRREPFLKEPENAEKSSSAS